MPAHDAVSLNRMAASATTHCLTGCAIGEVLGLVVATQLGWHDLPSIALAIVLAFVFGYALTIRGLLAAGILPSVLRGSHSPPTPSRSA